jgi:hypothetical protein
MDRPVDLCAAQYDYPKISCGSYRNAQLLEPRQILITSSSFHPFELETLLHTCILTEPDVLFGGVFWFLLSVNRKILAGPLKYLGGDVNQIVYL